MIPRAHPAAVPAWRWFLSAADGGSAQEGRAQGSAQEGRARGSAQDGRTRGSAQDGRAQGSAQEGRAQGSAQEGRTQGSAQDGRAAPSREDAVPSRADAARARQTCHRPVLITPVLEALAPRPRRLYLDATFGGGGVTAGLLQAGAHVLGVDRDATAIARGAALMHAAQGRLFLQHGCFSQSARWLQIAQEQAPQCVAAGQLFDGAVFDLGISSDQLLPERGFSFLHDGPLDMRMDLEQEVTAADLVNHGSQAQILEVIATYGQEHFAGRISRAIVASRPFSGTHALAQTIAEAWPAVARRRSRIHPATRSFQALRIWVNDELDLVDRGVAAVLPLLAPGAVLAVLSFHSLEDRLIKKLFKRHSRGVGAELKINTPSPLLPSPAEVAANPRARSARLHLAHKLEETP